MTQQESRAIVQNLIENGPLSPVQVEALCLVLTEHPDRAALQEIAILTEELREERQAHGQFGVGA